jgi:hypothetical protein
MIHERRDFESDVGVDVESTQHEYERQHDPHARHAEPRPDSREYRRGYRGNGRPIAEIVGDLRDEATLLVKQQVELLKAEMSAKASKWTRNAVYIAVGAFIAYGGFLFLLLAATFGVMFGLIEGGVAQVHALWAAPLIVGFVVAVVGYIFVQKGISTIKRTPATPRRTARTLREDKQWLQSKTH